MHIENVVGLMFVKIDIGMLILAILVSMLVNVPQSKLSFVWNFNPAHLSKIRMQRESNQIHRLL